MATKRKMQKMEKKERREWPSLDEQLEAAKVPRDSALARLIREHQDFHLLHRQEAQDHLGLPPWLRVYWRKLHPESAYAAHDPSGGYPRVLKRIYAWMLAHPNLAASSR